MAAIRIDAVATPCTTRTVLAVGNEGTGRAVLHSICINMGGPLKAGALG